MRLDVEHLLEGVTDDWWKYLDEDFIITCCKAPPEWISLMRRIEFIAEYVRAATQGYVPMEEEEDSEEEEEETEDETESKEDDSD